MHHMIELMESGSFSLKDLTEKLPAGALPEQVVFSASSGGYDGDEPCIEVTYFKPFTEEEIAEAVAEKEYAEAYRKARLESQERELFRQLQAKYGEPK